jgi:N utilization substance protein A
VVKRFERGDIILDLGRAEALLPRREQSRADHYNQDDRVRAVIVNVDRAARGPQVIVSRTDNVLLMKLFEMEVPEIYDGTVIIENIARDPGDRAKVGVRSKEKDIDPVGACVGIKGSRVQAIIRELRGEKIDIVQWADDASIFVANAMNPATVGRVTILDEQARILEVTVEDSQLSQAIGKKGQNVRLASQLIGWKIEIKSESDKKQEIEDEINRIARGAKEIQALAGVGERLAGSLMERGYQTLEEIVAANLDDLCKVPGIGDKTGEKLQESAQQAIVEREERLAREREEAEKAAQVEQERLAREQEEAEKAAQVEQERLAREQEGAEKAEAAPEGNGDLQPAAPAEPATAGVETGSEPQTGTAVPPSEASEDSAKEG